MKKIDLGQTINTLANIGVILGIVFLAFEINQNNSQLTAQSRYNYFRTRIDFSLLSATDPVLTPVLAKAALGEALSPEEDVLMNSFAIAALDAWRYEFLEYNDGRLSIEELDIPRKREIFNQPGMRAAFERNLGGPGWSEDFKDFLQQFNE